MLRKPDENSQVSSKMPGLTEAERELAKLVGSILAERWIEAQQQVVSENNPQKVQSLIDMSRKPA